MLLEMWFSEQWKHLLWNMWCAWSSLCNMCVNSVSTSEQTVWLSEETRETVVTGNNLTHWLLLNFRVIITNWMHSSMCCIMYLINRKIRILKDTCLTCINFHFLSIYKKTADAVQVMSYFIEHNSVCIPFGGYS